MQGELTSEFWPGWVSGVALASLIVVYFWITGRLLSSSGRVSVVLDRLRHGPTTECDMATEDLAEALRIASVEKFGESAVQASLASATAVREIKNIRPRENISWLGHLSFLIGLVLGGRASHVSEPMRWTLGERVWAGVVPEAALPYLLLFAGVLVGFGTRMAGGCPIGHGLCGMPRGQAGSWAASLAFFGAGVGISLLAGAL